MKKLLTLTLLLFCSSAFSDEVDAKAEGKRVIERAFNIADKKILDMINKDKNGCKKYVNTSNLEKHFYVPDNIDIDDEKQMDKTAKKWFAYILNGKLVLHDSGKPQLKSCQFVLDDVQDIFTESIQESQRISMNNLQARYPH